MSRTATSQSAAVNTGRSRALVAYFSRSGNTRLIAGKVRRDLGADLFEIEPSPPYPDIQPGPSVGDRRVHRRS
jgi:Flavodoxin